MRNITGVFKKTLLVFIILFSIFATSCFLSGDDSSSGKSRSASVEVKKL